MVKKFQVSQSTSGTMPETGLDILNQDIESVYRCFVVNSATPLGRLLCYALGEGCDLSDPEKPVSKRQRKLMDKCQS